MNDNEFFIRIWALAAMFLSVIVLSTAGYYAHKTSILAKSDNPLELSCAMDGDTYSLKQVCVTLTTLKGQK